MMNEETLATTPSGTWTIDPAHSAVTFSVRHLMSKVRGRFSEVEGHIVVGPTPDTWSAEASIAMRSVSTGTQMRDDDLRSERFFDTDAYPIMIFASTEVRDEGDVIALVGDLTIRAVTRSVTIEVEYLGRDQTGLQGEPRIGFSGRTTLSRSDFGVGQASVEGSKVIVGDAVSVELDIEAFLGDPEA